MSGEAHAAGVGQGEPRRDFLHLATATVAATGAAAAVWPLIDSMNPSADLLALSSFEIDLGPIPVGQRITVKWLGKPVFISHRTAAQTAELRVVRAGEARTVTAKVWRRQAG